MRPHVLAEQGAQRSMRLKVGLGNPLELPLIGRVFQPCRRNNNIFCFNTATGAKQVRRWTVVYGCSLFTSPDSEDHD